MNAEAGGQKVSHRRGLGSSLLVCSNPVEGDRGVKESLDVYLAAKSSLKTSEIESLDSIPEHGEVCNEGQREKAGAEAPSPVPSDPHELLIAMHETKAYSCVGCVSYLLPTVSVLHKVMDQSRV